MMTSCIRLAIFLALVWPEDVKLSPELRRLMRKYGGDVKKKPATLGGKGRNFAELSLHRVASLKSPWLEDQRSVL
jgi:hypothetical protein